MGKVQIIKKSRKEQRCSKCGKVIPVGSRYYKGLLNFHPDINRCTSCGLESWEVTTSDYQLQVGQIVYRWQDTYGVGTNSAEDISSELESIRDELQDKLDNMPEQLQESDSGMLLQERIESLESAIDELENIDIESLQESVLEECYETEDDEEVDWDELMDDESVDDETKYELSNALDEKISEEIESALSEINI